jgi:SNF2 family DNA or RNA helicase
MGVGKTIQAISIAYLFPREWPVLIITPASLKFSWRDELLQWIEYLRPDQIQVFQKSTEDFDPNACIYIMSYVIATKLSLPIQNKKFQIVICDEAHYLKSRDVSKFSIFNPIEFKK